MAPEQPGAAPVAGDPDDGEDFPTGPAVGEAIPDFALPDAVSGQPVHFSVARGQGQALILFYRSASW